ncbi:helix-turn-helix domain-containing protein [Simplicispira piscis]
MSLDAVSWAMDQSVGRSAAKLLLVTLAHCVNGKGTDNMVCFPSNAYLAERSELDKKSVTKNMRWLQDQGFLEKTGTRHGRTGQVLEYRLKEPNSGAVELVAEARKAHQISPESDPKTDQLQEGESTPLFPAKDTTFPPKAHHISPESDPNVVHGTSKEQVKEQVKEQRRARAKSSDLPEGFAEFWTEYPRKEGRTKALESWVKRGLDSDLALRERVMAALARHRTQQQWTKDNGQFIPHASTWLNQERYLDDVGPGVQAGRGQQAAPAGDWWTAAGFLNHWEAENHRCYPHNAHTFRDGKKLASQAEVPA